MKKINDFEKEFLQKQQDEIDKKKKELEDEKQKIEDQKQRDKDLKDAEEKWRQKAVNDIENSKIATDKLIEKLSKEEDYNRLREWRIVYQTSIWYEKERLIEFIKNKMEEIQKKEDQKLMEKEIKYQEFLEKYKWIYDKIENINWKTILLRIVAEFWWDDIYNDLPF